MYDKAHVRIYRPTFFVHLVRRTLFEASTTLHDDNDNLTLERST